MRVKVSFSKVRNLILVFVAAVGIFVGGYELGVKGYQVQLTKSLQVNFSRQVPPNDNVDFSLFWQVWDT